MVLQNRAILFCRPKNPRNPCSFYGVERRIPAHYFNNPHICDVFKKSSPETSKPRVSRYNVPRWSARKPALDKAEVRKERMKVQEDRNKRLRELKYPSNTSLTPVQSRHNIALQTNEYLEALYDNPPTATTCTQTTEARPQTPAFVPAKTGVDTCTQIYPDDLFFFDEEVKPILEVTTGNTIEQALMEVLHEEEINGMERERRRFMAEKCAEEAEIQRLEEEDRRKRFEMEERIAELEKAKAKQEELQKRLAAAMLSDRVCKELVPQVLEGMTAEGYYVDDAGKDVLSVRDEIMKKLENDVCEELKKIAGSEDILVGLIKDMVQERYDVYTKLGEHPMERFIKEAPPVPEIINEEEEEEGGEEQERLDFSFEKP